MANDKKFVVKNGLQAPNAAFVSPSGANTINVTMLDNGTLSFSGVSGQLFSITDSLSGTIFAVNDISGVPSIEVDDDGTIRFAETFGNVLIGSNVDDGTNKLQVNGNTNITGSLTIGGDFTVTGNIVSINVETLQVADNMIYLNDGSTITNPDLGWAGNYNSGTYAHAGFFRDATDGVFKAFYGYTPEPDASPEINISHASFQYAPIAGGGYYVGTSQVIDGTGNWVGPNSGLIGYTGSKGDTGAQGPIGYTGSRGYTGSQGIQGVIGYTGSQGIQGVIGYTGSQGIQGVIGYTGSRGVQGVIGYTGSQGVQGVQGVIGYTGSRGVQGYTGSQGVQGVQGVIGYTGSQGIQGIQGYTGSQGIQGPIGYTGSRGVQGYTGSQGPQGIQGPIGYTGSKGIQGVIGYTGSQGPIGYTGSRGVQGYTGSLGPIAGSDGQVIYNNGGISGGAAGLTYDDINIRVGVNTASPSYTLEVNGAFAATTKSFVITHPTKEGMKLRHGSLEGPEDGVYVRGILEGNVIELPEYWIGLVHQETITVNLTPIGKHQDLWVEDVINNTVLIGGETVKCFYTVYGTRKDIAKFEVEFKEN